MLTVSSAINIMKHTRRWPGPAILIFNDETIDGRVRQAAAALLPPMLRATIKPPVEYLKSRGHAACLLAMNGHPERALEYLTPFADSLRAIATETWLPALQCKQLLNALTQKRRSGKSRKQHHARTVAKVRALLQQDDITHAELANCVDQCSDWKAQRKVLGARIPIELLDSIQIATDDTHDGYTTTSTVIRAALATQMQKDLTDYLADDSRGAPSIVVTVLVGAGFADQVRDRAKQLHITTSMLVRASIESWLCANGFAGQFHGL
jgi:hypothetical protein